MTILKFDSFHQFTSKEYTGRGIVQGITPDSKNIIQIYWISGRSKESKSRIFKIDNGKVKVVSRNNHLIKSKNPGPFYTAMVFEGFNFIVSNGPQTELIQQVVRKKLTFENIRSAISNAPPSFVNTPRITGIISISNNITFYLSLHKPINNSSSTVFGSWLYECIPAGWGFCITTYKGNNNEPNPFEGEPFPTSIKESGENLLRTYWSLLNINTRICICLRSIAIHKHKWDIYTYNPQYSEKINHAQGEWYV